MKQINSTYQWDEFFMDMAWAVAQKSRDPSTKVGCVIATHDNQVVSVGYNGFPRGVENYEERWTTRPDKYDYVVHAERNAILNAAREGRSTKGCKMYLYYNVPPCAQCTLSVIQSGINELILGPVDFPGVGNGTHYDTNNASPTMLQEAGVRIRRFLNWRPKDENTTDGS